MEKFQKVRFRDYKDNTRLNINNVNYASMKEKRDRANNYWKDKNEMISKRKTFRQLKKIIDEV